MAHRDWTSRTIYVGGIATALFTGPDGIEYVTATPREKADMTLRCGHGLPPLRLRRWETSAARRKAKRTQRKAATHRAAEKATRRKS